MIATFFLFLIYMRLVALDTETTGMCRGGHGAVCRGHRIIEIGCVEVIDGVLSGRNFHRYVNPGVAIQPGAVKVHGITEDFLKDKPLFEEVVEDLLDFIGTSTVVIHNADFDTAFLDQEFRLLEDQSSLKGRVFRVIDTLKMARSMFPGVSNSLDNLADRFGVGRRGGYHGALTDAIMLAKLCGCLQLHLV